SSLTPTAHFVALRGKLSWSPPGSGMSHHSTQLIERAVRGDANALSELLEREGPPIAAQLHIARQWQSMIDPLDVMQVTYLEAFEQISRFDMNRAASFSAWLRQIAENNLRDAIRGLERQKQPQPSRRLHPDTLADSCVALYELLGATLSTPSRVAG